MTIQDFMDYYIKETHKIASNFGAIYEITKKWLFFNGQELVEVNRSKYRVLKFHRQACGDYYILPAREGNVAIAWEDDDNESYNVIVSKMFFKDFEKFLKDLKDEVSKNNKEQTERYQEYLRKLDEEQKFREHQQFQEFLRLKEIYEPQSTKSL